MAKKLFAHFAKIEIRKWVKWSSTKSEKQSKIIETIRFTQNCGCGHLPEVRSFTKGYNKRALTGKILVFWTDGRLLEVVANERWSHMEVLMYHKMNFNSLCSPRKQGVG